MPHFDLFGFSPAYSCEILSTPAPADARRFRDLGAVPGTFTPGIIVRVIPQSGPGWVGQFQEMAEPYLTGAFAHPCETRVVIASGGAVYVVPIDDPASYHMLGGAVKGVRRVPERSMIIVWDDQDLYACDERGTLWTVKRLGQDDLSVTDVTPTTISGTVPNYKTGHEVPFEVDVRSGTVTGGWLPPDELWHRDATTSAEANT